MTNRGSHKGSGKVSEKIMRKVQQNVSLQNFNTMAVPAQARYLVTVESVSEAQQAIEFARNNNLPVLVLGDGSNTIFEGDYSGLVILNRILGKKCVRETPDRVVVTAGAGENWHQFVEYTLFNNWFGLQNLGLIPGLVGAAPMQNIGAYGAEIKDTLVSVDYLDIASLEQRSLDNSGCKFAYRDSVFKRELAANVLITSVTFELSKIPNVNLSYPALAALFKATSKPTPRQVFDAVCQVRRSKLPMPDDIPNAGSFFKNPVIDTSQHQTLKDQYPGLVSFEVSEGYKLAAAWLIEYAGWKQKGVDGVRVHEHQALVIINPKKCSGQAVLEFAEKIQVDICAKFGVTLEIEPRVINQVRVK